MTVPTASSPARSLPRRLATAASLVTLALGVALIAARSDTQLAAAPPPSGKAGPTLVGGKPLFDSWPKDRKPDAVVILSGQSFGYLQPCGCSRPQIGGLERRAVLIKKMEEKKWPVVGVDLGDVHEEKPMLGEQGQMKYVAAMNSLREMGYAAVGVGRNELQADLFKIIAAYALQPPQQRPFTLAANAFGKNGDQFIPRDQIFPPPGKGMRPLVEDVEVAKAGDVSVGVAGVVGKSLDEENEKQKWNPILAFPDAKGGIEAAAKSLANHPLKPQLNVLIFQGPAADAAKAAADFPQFQVVLCRSETDLPPQQPEAVNHKDGSQTFVVQVGHRGQYVGLVGAFKKQGGGFDLHYQLVPLTEEFLTPGTDAEAIKANKVLQVLEDYAAHVKKANLLPKYPRVKHPEQIRAAGLNPPVQLSFVGSDACKACHAAEFAKWKETRHSHAMETLVKYATRPSLREFDGECVQCHSVGFHYETGAYDPKNDAKKNVLLHDVGCENCHGPGSGHVANPKDKNLLAFMSPWKQPGADKLPDAKFMQKMADTPAAERGKIAIQPAQQLLIRRVEGMCMKCHDHDADPHFDIYKSWPKIEHPSPPAVAAPAVPAKK